MIVLTGTTESLVVTLGGANAHDFIVGFETLTAGERVGDGKPDAQETALAATTANTVILTAPLDGSTKVVQHISVRNTTGNSTTVAISKRVSSTNYAIGSTVTLASQQSVVYDSNGKPTVYNATGEKKADA